MSQVSDILKFAPEIKKENKKLKDPWKILIADDEKDVHTLSKLVLSSLTFDDRHLEILEAYNGREVKKILIENPDCALILLDVVMDSDSEGLSLVKWIREQNDNQLIRIILRTGQPGDVPEKDLIINYDIDGYKEKTELTDQKLFTSVYTALRSFKDLKSLEDNKKALEDIIHSSTMLFSSNNFHEFIYRSMYHLTPLVTKREFETISTLAFEFVDTEFKPIWGSGEFCDFTDVSQILELEEWSVLDSCAQGKSISFSKNMCGLPIIISDGRFFIFFLKQKQDFTIPDNYLLEIYLRNIEVGLEKTLLTDEIEETQKEIIYTLGDVVESRSEDTGSHVKRVGDMSYKLGKLYGFSENECELLKTSSPMHDIGKISIPESVLNKKEPLTQEEKDLMKTHTTKGYEILKGSKRKIIKSAAIIALQHHERWDGSGYPMGLEGEHIHPFARITTVVDIFDALFHERVYKKAWPVSEIVEFYKEEAGRIFDPYLAELFLENIEEFILISSGIE